jgi:hypothetical protein
MSIGGVEVEIEAAEVKEEEEEEDIVIKKVQSSATVRPFSKFSRLSTD